MRLRTGCAIVALALSGALAAPASAQSAAGVSPAPASEASPPMWRVTDADSEIFLLGTFHVLPQGMNWRSPAVDKAIEASPVVWFEAEVDTPAARQATLNYVMTQGFNANGGKLTEMLAPADAAKLQTIVSEIGLPMAAIDPMRPWQAFLTLSVQFIVSKGFDPSSGVESTLLSEMRNRGRTLHYFETVEQQLGFFGGFSSEQEMDLLLATLRDWDQYADDFGALFAAWRTGDAEKIDSMMNESLREQAPAVFNVLVTKRNTAWAEALAKEMAGSGTELVAVGAGHLVGKGSLPDLLAAKGFKVERYGVATSAAASTFAPANDNAPASDDIAADPIGDILQDLGSDSATEN